jgi:formate hydrogenlyase subunit 3/multisubunit Na+/H+ antiporter MnhD subunit
MILLALGLPLLLAFACLVGVQHRLRWLLPAASLPVLGLALMPETRLELDWLLFGLELGGDALTRPFLLLLGLTWSLAAWHALDYIGQRQRSFWFFWLLTLGGISLAFLARDAAGFYCGYAVMGLAAYGLILHERSAAARRAGRIYLMLALFGEVLILTGLFQLGARFGNFPLAELGALLGERGGGIAGGCLLAGFAVKMGVLPLHIWLPLAHPVAPAPASAILSGVIVKAGLLGWLRFLPPQTFGASIPVIALVLLGLAAAFYAALRGLTRTEPKAILAWSTVSQLGLLLVLFAAASVGEAERALLLPIIGIWVLHHGLNKSALFLATVCSPTLNRWRLLLFAVPALSIAGLPLTTGGLAKGAAKEGLARASLPDWTLTAFGLSSITTALLLWHLFDRLRQSPGKAGAHPAWVMLTLLAISVPWLWAVPFSLVSWPTSWWDGLWPLLLASAIAVSWKRLGWALPVWPGRQGDPWSSPAGYGPDLPTGLPRAWMPRHQKAGRALLRLEGKLSLLPVVGLGLLGLLLGIWLVLIRAP